MGVICCVTETLSTSDRILFWQTVIIGIQTFFVLAGIFVSAGVGIWIVKTLQDKLANKRVLKDHIIDEVKELRLEYRDFFKKINEDTIIAVQVLPWFKLMSLKADDLLKIANVKYHISTDVLKPYQVDLEALLTENTDFTTQFRSGLPIIFSPDSKNEFVIFEQNNNHLFNDIIMVINESE
jgi:hypothetical protein